MVGIDISPENIFPKLFFSKAVYLYCSRNYLPFFLRQSTGINHTIGFSESYLANSQLLILVQLKGRN